MTATASAQQLDRAAHEFAAVRARFDALMAGVREEQWASRPSPSEWSVAECIAHLNLTSAAMLPRIRAAFDEARAMPPVGARAYAQSTLGWILGKTVGPAPRIAGMTLGRVRTPPPFVPGSDLPRDQVMDEFTAWREAEERLVRDAEGLAIDRVRIESPFRAETYYDGWSALLILARHELRHLVQAERAYEALAAPPAS